jgi:hypothetical protein
MSAAKNTQTPLDRQKVKEMTINLAFMARTVIQQVAAKNRSPEAYAAMDILEDALNRAIPDANEPSESERPERPAFAG